MAVEPQPTPETMAEQVGLAHALALAQVRAATWAAIEEVWSAVTPNVDLLTWWFGGPRDEIVLLLSMAQELAALDATRYVRDAMAVQGFETEVAEVRPRAFSGVASDGRGLDTLVDRVPFRALEARDAGITEAEALARALELLIRIVHTQVTDAGREADGVAVATAQATRVMSPEEVEAYVRERQVEFINPLSARDVQTPDDIETYLAQRQARRPDVPLTRAQKEARLAERKRKRPAPIGWIRLLTPPSCARCALLAGKWYGWNDGFERHDNCDCRHVPAVEADAGTMLTDPFAYFLSLPPEEQERIFGKANAQAIREGADIVGIVNAAMRRGAVYTVNGTRYTREGATRRKKAPPRKTPVQIYRDANGDREAARRMLAEFGYIEG